MKIVILIALMSTSAFSYYGAKSAEANLTFNAKIQFKYKKSAIVLENYKSVEDDFTEKIEFQIKYLMGVLQAESFIDQFGFPGVIGEDHFITITSIREIKKKFYEVEYAYQGKMVLHKDAFKNTKKRLLPLTMPLNPDSIYADTMVGDTNSCTDDHYQAEADFWYFWDPFKEGCELIDYPEKLVSFKAVAEKMPNTRVSYPEYNLLYGNNKNLKTFEIAVFFGLIRDENINPNRINRRDEGYQALRYSEKELLDKGFVLTEKTNQGSNLWRVYEQQVDTALGMWVKTRVKLYLGDTGINSPDDTFHNYLVPAFAEADVLVYDGHSGLGGNLDLSYFPEVKFHPKKYQIFFFNGCSTYPYFNGMFFKAKGGTKYLDIVTSGLPTFAITAGPNVMAFLDGFLEGKTLSYQTILRRLETSNDDTGTYLTGVNGDDDNLFNISNR